MTPILGRVQMLVEDAQPKISSMMSDATEITRVARTQVQRVDRVMVEAVDRLRLQLVHADQILTGALETIEDTGAKLRKTLWGPVQSVSALVRGIQVGLEFFRGMRTRRPPAKVRPNSRTKASSFSLSRDIASSLATALNRVLQIQPPPRHSFTRIKTAAWPGVTARCGSRKRRRTREEPRGSTTAAAGSCR